MSNVRLAGRSASPQEKSHDEKKKESSSSRHARQRRRKMAHHHQRGVAHRGGRHQRAKWGARRVVEACAAVGMVAWLGTLVWYAAARRRAGEEEETGAGVLAWPNPSLRSEASQSSLQEEHEEEEEEKERDTMWWGEAGGLENVSCREMLEGFRDTRPEDIGEFKGMRYWRRQGEAGATELGYRSPYARTGSNKKYLSFEPDAGGFNNVRMAFETVAVFAHATGRILVMPPKQRIYLLKQTHTSNPKAVHGLGAFVNLDALARRVEVLDASEFAQREKDGVLRDVDTEKLKRLSVRAEKSGDVEPRKKLRAFLRNACPTSPKWDPLRECVLFGESAENETDLPWRYLTPKAFATPKRRLRRIDAHTVDAPWIHFRTNASFGYRIFTHWYTFFQFADGPTDAFYKRFVRDTLRYNDDVFCAAGAVVTRLLRLLKSRQVPIVKGGNPGDPDDSSGAPLFSAVHVRRGELQFVSVRITAEQWRDALAQWLLPREPLFVLSDESDRRWFDPIRRDRPLFFLDDLFRDPTLDPNKLGMIEQLVAASPYTRTFTGTHFSTFSAYVARLRAYYGHPDHTFFYAAPKEKQFVMRDLASSRHPKFPFYNREWAAAWTNLDLPLPSSERTNPRLLRLPDLRVYQDLPPANRKHPHQGKPKPKQPRTNQASPDQADESS